MSDQGWPAPAQPSAEQGPSQSGPHQQRRPAPLPRRNEQEQSAPRWTPPARGEAEQAAEQGYAGHPEQPVDQRPTRQEQGADAGSAVSPPTMPMPAVRRGPSEAEQQAAAQREAQRQEADRQEAHR
jgi:hypothetical protein